MVQIKTGSPRWKLALSDAMPIAIKWAKGVGAFALATGLAALGSEEFKAVVVNHGGTLAAGVFTAFLAVVTGQRLISDNSKG